MCDTTSYSHTSPSPPGTPADAETQRRQAFQQLHPEVGFAFRAGCETPWIAYWLPPAGERRYVTGTILCDVLDQLAEAFANGAAPAG
jgi:hypothetical protein